MSDNDGDTFRVQARFNKVEYADLLEDLERFAQGSQRAGRIRHLMRLGLAVAKRQIPSSTLTHGANLVHGATVARDLTPSEPADPHTTAADFDLLSSLGCDPLAFGFRKPS